MECASRVEAIRPLYDGSLNVADRGLHLTDDRVIAGDHNDRYAEVTSDSRVKATLGHLGAVDVHRCQLSARGCVGADAIRVRRAGVVADEDGAVERFVDPLHHAEWPRPGPDDLDVRG